MFNGGDMSKSTKALKTAPAVAPRFTRLDDAILDSKTGLIWSLQETEPMNWKDAQTHCASLSLLGFSDWRLPACDELLTLVDRSRVSPAIDVEFFPKCKSDWYWTSTPTACSPGVYAWVVDFGNGFSGWDDRDDDGCVRAVRASQ
jgi:Protein of unknown function (DUF1566)